MLSAAEARAANDDAKARVREAERRCRLDFMTRPDHEERCICSPPCSRDYDPTPPDPSLSDDEGDNWLPHPIQDYEGTGVGALYGLPMSAAQAADLAGWNLKPRSEIE